MFVNKIAGLLLQYAKVQAKGTVAQALLPVGPYLQKIAVGVACVIVSVACFLLTVLLLVVSLLVGLAQYPVWLHAGLWTALATGGLGVILLVVGLVFFKKPDIRP